jgi:hypothetical protein
MRGYRGGVTQALNHSAYLRRITSHQIAGASQQRQRTARTAYLGIADIVVCIFSDALVLQLGVSTPARSVVFSRASQRHIVAQRKIACAATRSLQPIGFTKHSQTCAFNGYHNGAQTHSS